MATPLTKIKLKRFSCYVTDAKFQEIPYMGQQWFFGFEFLGKLPEYIKQYRIITIGHEIITDWLPLDYKAEVIQPNGIRDRILIEFDYADTLPNDIKFPIDSVLRLGY